MTPFRAMGCEIELAPGVEPGAVRALFEARDQRFSRFVPGSELNRVNAQPAGVAFVSVDFAELLALALAAARATSGLVTPTVGAAVVGCGYDADFDALPRHGAPVEPVAVPHLGALELRGRKLFRRQPVTLDLNGVVKGRTVDDALALAGHGWIVAGGDLATTEPLDVGLPAGGYITLESGGLATSSTRVRSWRRGGTTLHHLIDPATGTASRSPWTDVTVAAGTCVAADVAAKAALLLGDAGPAWLERRGLAGRLVHRSGRVVHTPTWPAQLELAA